MTTSPVMSITDELLAEIEQLADKATPGPWSWDGREVDDEGYVYIPECSYLVGSICLAGDYEGYQDDCDFMAKANPATIKALLAHIADLKQQVIAAGITAENCELFRRDAERYQWLREQCQKYEGGLTICKVGYADLTGWSGDDPDAAIDAAMEATQ